MELFEICEYRSKPEVNITNDRVRVVMSFSMNEWRMFKKQHEIKFSDGTQYSSKED